MSCSWQEISFDRLFIQPALCCPKSKRVSRQACHSWDNGEGVFFSYYSFVYDGASCMFSASTVYLIPNHVALTVVTFLSAWPLTDLCKSHFWKPTRHFMKLMLNSYFGWLFHGMMHKLKGKISKMKSVMVWIWQVSAYLLGEYSHLLARRPGCSPKEIFTIIHEKLPTVS